MPLRATTEHLLEVAINHAPIALWMIDREGVVLLSEGAGLARLGVKSGELVGKSLFELYAGHPTIPNDIRRALAGESFTYTTDAGTVTYETWLAPTRDSNGEIDGALGVSTDVTERDKLHAQIIRNDRVRVLGMLAASVAHEVNNPLTYAILSMEHVTRAASRVRGTLAQPDPDPECALSLMEDLATPLETVSEGLRRIRAVTADLRTFARADQRTALVDVRATLESVIQLVSKELRARARLVIDLREVPLIFASEARMGQVFLNLLLNALNALPEDATDRDHEVRIVARTDGDSVVVTVSDTGAGVPREIRGRLFEPFVSGKPEAGTGLGLFVCMNIVRGLGGTLTFADRADAGVIRGTDFEVRLPSTPTQPATVTKPPELSARRSARILVAEEDDRVSAALAALLVDEGYDVVRASGSSALDLVLSEPAFDLCYVEVMHDGSGVELYNEIERRAPARKDSIVLMTGGACPPAARRFVDAKPTVCVEKPFDVLAETARRLSAGASPSRP